MLSQTFDPVQIRVLGALIEKQLATPDHYPLSLNALTAACNQSSNRDPVMALDETTVSATVDSLRRAGLVRSFQSSGSRVPKYQHLIVETFDLSPPQLAVLCVLMLRGPQTQAEVRTRAARLVPPEDARGVEMALEALIERKPPGASHLPRRPGQKETRYAHTLGGVLSEAPDDPHVPEPAPRSDRIAALEETVAELRNEVADIRTQLAEFRKQFE
jgi:uncharacterized protein YceH (UPF0502 family)